MIAEGAGGLDEAKEYCPPNKERYIYVRRGHQVDLSYTAKFAYIDWTPDTLSPMRKALLTTHKGQAEKFFLPYHVFLKCNDMSGMTDSVIADKIEFASGTKVNETDKKASGALTSGILCFLHHISHNLLHPWFFFCLFVSLLL